VYESAGYSEAGWRGEGEALVGGWRVCRGVLMVLGGIRQVLRTSSRIEGSKVYCNM
jgi:hypothetical protein